MMKAIKVQEIEGSASHRLTVLALVSEDTETTYPIVLDCHGLGYDILIGCKEDFDNFIQGFARHTRLEARA
jgi:hypothetical protein